MAEPKHHFLESALRFARESRHHEMTILHDDGLYRHLRFVNPDRRWAYWFDLITWPGNLVFRGDGETFAFARSSDMFEFFRRPGGYGDGLGINPGYWSEKLTDSSGRDRAQSYSEKDFKATVEQELVEAAESGDWSKGQLARIRKAIGEAIDGPLADYDTSHEHGAREFLRGFHCDVPNRVRRQIPRHGSGRGPGGALWKVEDKRFEFSPDVSHEADLRDWDWWFLWCCHAIQAGIDCYDRAKADASDVKCGGCDRTVGSVCGETKLWADTPPILALEPKRPERPAARTKEESDGRNMPETEAGAAATADPEAGGAEADAAEAAVAVVR